MSVQGELFMPDRTNQDTVKPMATETEKAADKDQSEKGARKKKDGKRGKGKKEAEKRTRAQRPFPSAALQDSMVLGETMHKMGAVPKVRRLTLFEHLKKSPDSSASRQ